MENPEGFVFDDELAVPPLEARGYRVEMVPWTIPTVDWNRFDIVIPRTTWDYHHQVGRFLSVMETIDRSDALLANSVRLFRWNAHKSYLLDLEKKGIPIVPTVLGKGLDREEIDSLKQRFGHSAIVLKPTIGANADFTWPVRDDTPDDVITTICSHYRDREFLAQPFITNVVTEGEFSLFYFNGTLSHTILKTPKRADFRVQEEHGGIITAVKPEARMVAAADLIMTTLSEVPLYARVDFVRSDDEKFYLMELELIEPALYFRMDPGSPDRFAEAVDRVMSSARS